MALRAGPLAMTLQHGQRLPIRCGAHEVWHGVALVFRDADSNRKGELLRAHRTGERGDIDMGGWAASARAATLDANSTPRRWRSPRSHRGAAPQLRLPTHRISGLTPV